MLLAVIGNVRSYHLKQRPKSWVEETEEGGLLGMPFAAINRVGFYILGRKQASFHSYHDGYPGQIAGLQQTVWFHLYKGRLGQFQSSAWHLLWRIS
ncbi:MAG: hypothetical protein GWN55_11845 [Phycisphaerae bacterium]|nr:hypothetical protein [candidate division KSB1 bacterium]NIV01992.1 hypothetical protein [Phycisphaerae bacterium]NIR73016.1 hypothetical protein [candidate division KSB1 bacterium]NIT73753.1 hypothetical protein [candidate division KSB1 bacterium]NIU27658.1 hypothetical protein [candidate division KSB1 bacterium]